MNKTSKTALAAVLLASAAGLVAAPPAVAKDKKDQQAAAQQGPQLKLSADFRKVAAPAQQALNSGDLATAATGIAATEAAAKTDDEKYIAEQLKLSLIAKQAQAAGNGDAAGDTNLAAPLDALLANPVTPKDQLGKYAYLRGTIAFEQKKYPDALGYYQKAQAAGYQNPDMPLQIAKAKIASGDIPGGVAEIDTVVKQDEASGQKAPEDLYRYAIANLYKTTDRAATLDWVRRWLQAYPSAKNWRDAIYVFGFQGPTAAQLGKAQKIDLYRLMEVTDSLADEGDYLQYAQYCLDVGLPDDRQRRIAVVAGGQGEIVVDRRSRHADRRRLSRPGQLCRGDRALQARPAEGRKGQQSRQPASRHRRGAVGRQGVGIGAVRQGSARPGQGRGDAVADLGVDRHRSGDGGRTSSGARRLIGAM